MIAVKPPLGIMPHDIWIEKRIQDLLEAMRRYSEANMVIPIEWIDELDQLIKGESYGRN